jgi:hypothetical protein
MRGLTKTQRFAVERACLTLGGGSVGTVGMLALGHSPGAPTAVIVGLATALAGNALASLGTAAPGIITALSAKKVARIKARADAQVAVETTRQRTTLVNAGLDGKLDAALSLLKLQLVDAQLLLDPRFRADTLRELMPDPRGPGEDDLKLTVIRRPQAGD